VGGFPQAAGALQGCSRSAVFAKGKREDLDKSRLISLTVNLSK